MFNLFKKNKIPWLKLPRPDDSTDFFEILKIESEKYWAYSPPNPSISGLQIQQYAKWNPGLNDADIHDFENLMGYRMPPPLINFYKTMNGLTKPAINLYGSSGQSPSFHPIFYSYPNDIELILSKISWIYESNNIQSKDLEKGGISRIFPVYSHRFMLIDIPGNPILSMYGDDIIYYADNLSKLLLKDIFSNIENVRDFESRYSGDANIKFWLDKNL